MLFAQRCHSEVRYSRHHPDPFPLRDIASSETIQLLFGVAGLEVTRLVPVIGVLGTLAKQISRAADPSRLLSFVTYPLQLALAGLDGWNGNTDLRRPSAGWVLLARRPIGAHRVDPALSPRGVAVIVAPQAPC